MDAIVLNLFKSSLAVNVLHKQNRATVLYCIFKLFKIYSKFKFNFKLWMLVSQIFFSLWITINVLSSVTLKHLLLLFFNLIRRRFKIMYKSRNHL